MQKKKLMGLLGTTTSLPSMPGSTGLTNSTGNKFEGGNINEKVANTKIEPKDDSEEFLEKNLGPLYYDFY